MLRGAQRASHARRSATYRDTALSDPVSPELCKAYALECRRMAMYAPSPRQRVVLLELAEEWERMATQIASANEKEAAEGA